MRHLDEGTIHAWLDGALGGDEARSVETHLADCATCADAVADARGLVAASSRILNALDVVPGAVIPERSRESVAGRGGGAARGGRRDPWWRSPFVQVAAAGVVMVVGAVAVARRGPGSAVEVRVQGAESRPAPRASIAATDSMDFTPAPGSRASGLEAKVPVAGRPAPPRTAPLKGEASGKQAANAPRPMDAIGRASPVVGGAIAGAGGAPPDQVSEARKERVASVAPSAAPAAPPAAVGGAGVPGAAGAARAETRGAMSSAASAPVAKAARVPAAAELREAGSSAGAAPRADSVTRLKSPALLLRGRVLSEDGSPISGALVGVAGTTNEAAHTGTDGRYVLTLPAGGLADTGVTLVARSLGYHAATTAVRAVPGDTLSHDFTLRPASVALEEVVVTQSAGSPRLLAANTVRVSGAPVRRETYELRRGVSVLLESWPPGLVRDSLPGDSAVVLPKRSDGANAIEWRAADGTVFVLSGQVPVAELREARRALGK